LNNGQFTATDRLVYKFYGSNVGGGDHQSLTSSLVATTPVRALLPLPVNVTLQANKVFYDNTGQNLVATNVQDAINEIDDLVEEGLTQVVVVKYEITAADDTAMVASLITATMKRASQAHLITASSCSPYRLALNMSQGAIVYQSRLMVAMGH
jgi:hypothetical protein